MALSGTRAAETARIKAATNAGVDIGSGWNHGHDHAGRLDRHNQRCNETDLPAKSQRGRQ